MILFIHGIYQCAGVFLPLIRSLVGNSPELDDKFLIDSFCLWLPGYDKKDREFNYKYIEDEICEFTVQKKQVQYDIASQLLFSENSLPAKIIKEEKLNLFGYDIGAGIGLCFTVQNPEMVSSVAMLDCGNDFSNLRSKWTLLNTNRLLNQSSATISRRYETETDTYKKIFLSSISTYPAAKGIKSYLNLFKTYDFGSTFNKISIDQQKQISQIKILNLVDKKFGLSNNSSTKKLQTTLDKKYRTVTKQGIFIKSQSHKNLYIDSISVGTKSILDSQVASSIADKLKSFYA
jgi:hypothetical protein